MPTVGDDPAAVYLAIHEHMTAVETHLAAEHAGDLVVFDGPLRGGGVRWASAT